MKADLQTRLRKIKGQIEGVEKMIAQKRACEEVVQQLQAVRSAIKGVIILLLEDDLCRLLPEKRRSQMNKKFKLLFKVK